jgi:hypothetical protein
VDDPGGVGGGERVGERDDDPQRLAEAHSLAGDEGVEGLAGDELHDDEVEPFGRLDLVDGDDVGVVEGGGGAGLLDETGAASRVREVLGGKDLDRHLAPQPRVAGAVDLAHPPGPEGLEDLVGAEASSGRKRHAATLSRVVRPARAYRLPAPHRQGK